MRPQRVENVPTGLCLQLKDKESSNYDSAAKLVDKSSRQKHNDHDVPVSAY